MLYLILAQMPLETSEVLVKSFSPPFMAADAWLSNLYYLFSQGLAEVALFYLIYLITLSWEMLPRGCFRGGAEMSI